MSSILAFIQAGLAIFEFIKWAKAAWGEAQLNAFLNGIETTIDGLKKAKTPEEKSEAAKNMVDLIRRIPN